MHAAGDDETDELLDRAGQGDRAARETLFTRYRARLRQLVASRLDRRLTARVDPSDVVQEALLDADRKLSDFARRKPIPFYPWLRMLALERLIDLHRRHVVAQNRSVTREEARPLPITHESALELGDRLLALGGTPISRMVLDEMRDRVREALAGLSERDREILVLRHLEQLSVKEIAATLDLTEGAVKTRHVRALQRFRALIEDPRSNHEQPSEAGGRGPGGQGQRPQKG